MVRAGEAARPGLGGRGARGRPHHQVGEILLQRLHQQLLVCAQGWVVAWEVVAGLLQVSLECGEPLQVVGEEALLGGGVGRAVNLHP